MKEYCVTIRFFVGPRQHTKSAIIELPDNSNLDQNELNAWGQNVLDQALARLNETRRRKILSSDVVTFDTFPMAILQNREF